MSRPKVYVAGPIVGHSYDSATGWRARCEQELPGCEVLTPMRGKEHLAALANMPLTSEELVAGGENLDLSTLSGQMSSERGIWRRDTWDVSRCDLVLANFLPGDEIGKVSIGTACEVFLAGFLHTPAVAVLAPNGIHDHPFITGSCWVVVRTLEEGFRAARIALNLRT